MAAPSGTGGTPAAVTDGGGAADVRRASSRRSVRQRDRRAPFRQRHTEPGDLYAATPTARRSVASGIRCKSAGVVPGFMIRLGDGTDSFGAAGGLAGGDGAWPELGGRFEQRAAQVLQQPQAVGGHVQAAPAAGGPVQDGPDEGEAAGLAGEPADDLGPAAGLAEGALDEVGVPDRGGGARRGTAGRRSALRGRWSGTSSPRGRWAPYLAAISLIRASMSSTSFGPGGVFRSSVSKIFQ